MRADDFERWQVGDAQITRIVEIDSMPIPPTMLFEHATAEMVSGQNWLTPDFADSAGNLFQSIQCFVVEAGGQRIVVDTCVGNDKQRAVEFLSNMHTPFLETFTRAGFTPGSIDAVLCTHLHVDHVGWNTYLRDGRWVATFPNARYLFGRREWAQVSASGHADPMGDFLADSLLPIVNAGQCDLVESDHVVNDSVRLVPTPGHTPGHVSVLIESRGHNAIITGDMIHHPLQCVEPALYSRFCADPARSIQTRQQFLEQYSGTEALVIGSHFSAWTAGHIVAAGKAYRFKRRG